MMIISADIYWEYKYFYKNRSQDNQIRILQESFIQEKLKNNSEIEIIDLKNHSRSLGINDYINSRNN